MRQRRSAFTLLEVLIASALLSTLMLVVWSLFSTFTRLEERTSRVATELQLVRSISQQLRSDIAHFATLPTKPGVNQQKSGASSATSNKEQPSAEEVVESTVAMENTELTTPNPNVIDTSLRIDFGQQPELDRNQLKTRQEFDSSLLDTMFLRGSATKLELVTRLPYTVDVPTGNQLLGVETRYGTHQLVIYEWRDVRQLETLLRDDPILNPAKFNPPPTNPVPNTLLTAPLPLVATRLNPNDNVGLIRETKSWLHVTRDQRRDALSRQAEASGVLVDGKFPWELQLLPQEQLLPRDTLQSPAETFGRTLQPTWAPPPEFRHRRDHIPEVTRLQFRYFDGEAWRLDWNDDLQIPKAIEIAFDLDPEAPAVRAKEFEEAHAAMLGGASMAAVLPPKDELLEEELTDLDPPSDLNTLDPTAIATEYRFIIGVTPGPEAEDKNRNDEPTLHSLEADR